MVIGISLCRAAGDLDRLPGCGRAHDRLEGGGAADYQIEHSAARQVQHQRSSVHPAPYRVAEWGERMAANQPRKARIQFLASGVVTFEGGPTALDLRLSVWSHGRENGREDLKMAISLEFWHFQPAAWK
jgi:hypothetical protein